MTNDNNTPKITIAPNPFWTFKDCTGEFWLNFIKSSETPIINNATAFAILYDNVINPEYVAVLSWLEIFLSSAKISPNIENGNEYNAPVPKPHIAIPGIVNQNSKLVENKPLKKNTTPTKIIPIVEIFIAFFKVGNLSTFFDL